MRKPLLSICLLGCIALTGCCSLSAGTLPPPMCAAKTVDAARLGDQTSISVKHDRPGRYGLWLMLDDDAGDLYERRALPQVQLAVDIVDGSGIIRRSATASPSHIIWRGKTESAVEMWRYSYPDEVAAREALVRVTIAREDVEWAKRYPALRVCVAELADK
jgi:hypothetical protein